MNLYSIDERLSYLIEGGFDNETGEVLDQNDLTKAINETEMELDKKIENIACFIKNLNSDVEALKKERQNLDKRLKFKQNKIESLTKYLDSYFRYSQPDYFNKTDVKFKKFETSKCLINYRKSDKIKIDDINLIDNQFIKPHIITESDIDKAKIKKILKAGQEVQGAKIEQSKNIGVK